jgi:hypothetical protein
MRKTATTFGVSALLALPGTAVAAVDAIPPANPSMVIAASSRCPEARAAFASSLETAHTFQQQAVAAARRTFLVTVGDASRSAKVAVRTAGTAKQRSVAREAHRLAIRTARAARQQAKREAVAQKRRAGKEARAGFRVAAAAC